MRISPTLLALLLAADPAFAQFEGVLEFKMTMTSEAGEGSGTSTIAASTKAGTRSEINMKMGPMSIHTVMLQMNATPDTLYRINDANKTYTEVDLAKMRELAGRRPKVRKYTVEKLGRETMLGYNTQHVLVKEAGAEADQSAVTELWTAKDLLDYETFSKMQVRRGKDVGDEAMLKALKDAGADGMPLKSVASTADGGKVTMEVVKVDKKSLPASTFEIPAGYTKSDSSMMDMLGGMSGPQADGAKKDMDEARQKMQDALKNMSPEQREMIEKMMKQRGAPNQ
jgi:hypothetical protein